MGDRTLLLTGGAGYIGSHVARDLVNAGYEVIILDDLSRGFAAATMDCELVRGDVGDKVLLTSLLNKHRVQAVLHFAGSTIVPESVEKPLMYYENNTVKSRNLMEASAECGVNQFIFSSSAAVYGIPETGRVTLETPTEPVNPYGLSKLMTELMLRDLARVSSMKYAALRYFNVAGADPGGRIGQSTPGCTLLIKVACEAALGKREQLYIYGTDYPTPDGAGVRDYIHVSDLSAAHILALNHLETGRRIPHPQLRLWSWLQRPRSGANGGKSARPPHPRRGNRPKGRRPPAINRRRQFSQANAGLATPLR